MRVGAHNLCPARVRNIRAFHIGPERRWLDVAYSFLICPHGTIYEGRGWGRRTAANGTNVGNSWGHAVMVMVGEGETIPAPVYEALTALHLEHRRVYGQSELKAHSDFKATGCPGPVLSAWVARNPNPTVRPPRPSQEDDDLTPEQAKKLDEIHASLAGRNYADDLRRIRMSLRAIGKKLGIRVNLNGSDDDIVA
jgi:hypothetical protein